MQTNGFAAGYSDYAEIDTALPFPSSYLCPNGAGNIVYINTNGIPQWWPNCLANVIYPIAARTIVTSAVVNGVERTTTATNIVYAASTPVS